MTLTCLSCANLEWHQRDWVACSIHGQRRVMPLSECEDASYEPGSDEVELSDHSRARARFGGDE